MIMLNVRTVFVTLVAGSVALSAAQSRAQFTDASAEIDFLRTGTTNLTDGLAGAAWLDFNNDGLLDLFMPNGVGGNNALFRNDGDGQFTDVATSAGVANGAGNLGALAGDVNNDGWTDLFLTGDGAGSSIGGASPPKLYINNGDDTFTDATVTAGIPQTIEGWAAAFGDINNDGFLDIFITSPGNLVTGVKQKNVLLRNDGDGTFSDISASAGIDTDIGACVASFHDYDNDGLPDIFVGNCNDFTEPLTPIPGPFELFRNNGDETFTDVAASVGLAPAEGGDPSVGMGFPMGLAFADFDRDGDIDFFVTSVGTGFGSNSIALHQLYEKNGSTYTNVSAAAGVAAWEFGWGAAPADFNNDGHEDLFYTGSIPALGATGEGKATPGRLFRNNGGTFTMFREFGLENHFTSGVAVADYDNNGFPDVLVVVHDLGDTSHRSLLLRNNGTANNWITIHAVGTDSNRSAIGARVTVRAQGFRRMKEIRAGSSFASTNSPWLTFGLRSFERVAIQVEWPSGLTERFFGNDANQKITLVEGTGTAVGE